jgi:hypothetical protein
LARWTAVFVVLGNVAKVLLVKQAHGLIARCLRLGYQSANARAFTVHNLFALEVAAIGDGG